MLKDYSVDFFIPFHVLQDSLSSYGWIYGLSLNNHASLKIVDSFKGLNPSRIFVCGVYIVFDKSHKQELLGLISDLKRSASYENLLHL